MTGMITCHIFSLPIGRFHRKQQDSLPSNCFMGDGREDHWTCSKSRGQVKPRDGKW